MFALLMTICPCDNFAIQVCALFTDKHYFPGTHAEGCTMTLLGVYPTESLATKVRDELKKRFDTPTQIIEYLRAHTHKPRWTKREVARTRAAIKDALEIVSDEAERRKLMPF